MYSDRYVVFDIYAIDIEPYRDEGSIQWYQCRRESKYRYSGLLYDKLRCLLGYNYRNAIHLTNHSTDDNLHRDTFRFYTRHMCLERVNHIAIIEQDTTHGLDESVAQSLHFINY